MGAHRPGRCAGGRLRLGGTTPLDRLDALGGGGHFRRTEEAVHAADNPLSALVRDVVEPLVTVNLDGDGGAVRLDHLDFSGEGRDGGEDMHGAQQERKGGKNSSHGYWRQTMKPVPFPARSQALPPSRWTTFAESVEIWVTACLT